MISDARLEADLMSLAGPEADIAELLSLLPGGGLIATEEGDPVLWLSGERATDGLWASVRALHARTGLWPLLLEPLARDDDFRPWASGELAPDRMGAPSSYDPERVLSASWEGCTASGDPDDHLSESEREAVTAPYGRRWPGLAPGLKGADPVLAAEEYASHLMTLGREWRLGLVATGRGADSVAAAGWIGPVNHVEDTAEIAAVVRSWEDRFGAIVVGVGFADLYLSIAAPPTTPTEALPIAAEHFAFCPDSVWQGRHHDLRSYARELVDLHEWRFWWD
ncbi:uncharacterized protein DUF4253 [Actinocorallia herbida]|uniref:Uncharacterized protein DUF4253 n=1 Tax=Actinocorallia herbida TaxID=58109 RepID=A0A3N1CYJ7_9ACTN|nr:DUF4253 domain-containing protein [Actinocorallia herbida]ROO86350.1 uncharacterized protein DUF4253 [Actinocorallia herbida]